MINVPLQGRLSLAGFQKEEHEGISNIARLLWFNKQLRKKDRVKYGIC